MKKSMEKITKGLVRDRGVSWFPDLVDKSKFSHSYDSDYNHLVCIYLGKSIKIHLYWAMKNCGGDASKLRELIVNIVKHYQVCSHVLSSIISIHEYFQGIHTKCPQSSPCHMPRYTPSKNLLTDPREIQKLEKMLKKTYIYTCAESFSRV